MSFRVVTPRADPGKRIIGAAARFHFPLGVVMYLRGQQRAAIRKDLARLRRLVCEAQPARTLAVLQVVAQIEGEALVASERELPHVNEQLRDLLEHLRDAGILSPEKFESFGQTQSRESLSTSNHN